MLNDAIPAERAKGIAAGHAWYTAARLCAVYVDCGVSDGMRAGIEAAKRAGVRVEEHRDSMALATLLVSLVEMQLAWAKRAGGCYSTGDEAYGACSDQLRAAIEAYSKSGAR